MIDKYELLNNYPTQEEVKEFNNLKSKKNNKRWSWVEKKTSQALLVIILTTGVTSAYQLANPQIVEASSVEREQEKEKESFLEKKYKDASYEEVYKIWSKGFNDKIENEQKIIDGDGYKKYQKRRAKRKKKYLLIAKEMMGQLTIIKGYDEEGKYSQKARDNAKKRLDYLEKLYLKRILSNLGKDIWDIFWTAVKKVAKETGKVVDELLDQID